MKKLSIILIALLVTICLNTGFAGAAEYNLKLQTYYPPTMLSGVKGLAENIETMSNGRIKITVFSGGELVSSPNMLKGVKGGMIDMAVGVGFYFSEIKLGDIESGLPMAWQNGAEAEIIFDKLGLREIIAAEYKKAGVHYVSELYAAPYNITTKKPAASIADLTKMKLRSGGGSAKMFNSLGIATVSMPPEDIYLALSTGQIDGVLYGGAFEYKTMKFIEVAKYYNTTPIVNPLVDNFMINQKLWGNLPADLKAIINTAARQARWDYYNGVMGSEYEIRDTDYAGKLTSFSDDDVAKMTQAAVAVWDKEAKRSPEAAKAIELIKKLNRMMGRL